MTRLTSPPRAIAERATLRLRGLSAEALVGEHTRLAVAKKQAEQRSVEARHAVMALKRGRQYATAQAWQQANDAWDRAKQACVELDVELAALRPLLRAANIRASDAQRQTRAEAFVAVAKLHLPWETYTTLWRLVEATAGLAPGGEEEEP